MKPTMKPRKPMRPRKPTKPKKPTKPMKPVKSKKPKKGGVRLSQKRMDDFNSSLPIPPERRAAFYNTRKELGILKKITAEKMREVGNDISETYLRFKDGYKRWLEERKKRKANISPLRSSQSSLKPISESLRKPQHKLLPLPPQQRMSRSTILPLPLLPPQQRILRPLPPLPPLPLPQQRIPY